MNICKIPELEQQQLQLLEAFFPRFSFQFSFVISKQFFFCLYLLNKISIWYWFTMNCQCRINVNVVTMELLEVESFMEIVITR